MSPHQLQRTLASLLQGVDFQIIPSRAAAEFADLPILTLVSDSRLASPGALFVALAGVANDGHDFLEMAAVNGCPVLLCQSGRVPRERLARLNALVLEAPDSKEAYAELAANFFQRPAEELSCIGVTGTNGKTTTTYLLEEIFLAKGWNVGVIGTVNNRYTLRGGEKKFLDTRFTTPEAFILQQVLREMADAGVDHVIMEVSSHALEQARIGGIVFQAAAFTNLTRDHLDYHADMASYLQAKTKLFSRYLHPRGTAVLPVPREGDVAWEWLGPLHKLCGQTGKRIVGWGEGNDRADIRLRKYHSRLDFTELEIETAAGIHTLVSPLVGRYNVDNILTVFGLCLAMDIDHQEIAKALTTAAGAPGRLERVTVAQAWNSRGPVVFVDYAHTPDALEKVLVTVKALPHRELLCVFGCGGDRDNGKRPLMGAIAAKLADVTIITDDNPRTEDPDRIIAQILAGVDSAGGAVHRREWLQTRHQKHSGSLVIRDRKQAIDAAIRVAGPEDIVVIAGKGHETYQLTLQGKRFFDDRLEARNSLLAWTDELVAGDHDGVLQPGTSDHCLYGPVFTDSRKAGNGGVFVALKGDTHDAHDYLGQAVTNGAACLVVEHVPQEVAASAASRVIVADTQRALGDMAAYRRRMVAQLSSQKIIGITGSCGKTTVKEMVTAILARKWPAGAEHHSESVLKTQGNFNNLIGLPLSLLPLSVNHRAAVLEMGMNRPGELLRLGEIADPDISCITNIHAAHLEGLGSIEGVARAKAELFAATKPSATLIVNLDDPWVCRIIEPFAHPRLTFAPVCRTVAGKTRFLGLRYPGRSSGHHYLYRSFPPTGSGCSSVHRRRT